MNRQPSFVIARSMLALLLLASFGAAAETPAPYGIDQRPVTKPYLEFPTAATGTFPARLSQTGAFTDTATLKLSASLIPFTVNAALWSDAAHKLRWMALPFTGGAAADPQREQIGFTPTGEWSFPAGTVFVKHFELAMDDRDPGKRRRLETRFLVRDAAGGVYGVTYKWREDGSDADLLSDGKDEDLVIATSAGVRHQIWHYPSRAECLLCHTANAGGVLGVKTRQLNGAYRYPDSGVSDNQLRTWNHLGLLRPAFDEQQIATLPRTVALGDHAASLEDRVRSYLDANCGHCHRPGGVNFSNFDARHDTPLAEQNLVGGRPVIDRGIDRARNIAAKDIWRSIVHLRMNALDAIKMPPLARAVVDAEAVATLTEWINSLPGKTALAPLGMTPDGGNFPGPVTVTLSHPDALTIIRYTIDGSLPDAASDVYSKPLIIDAPTTLRAKAFRDGYNSSIAATATYIVGK